MKFSKENQYICKIFLIKKKTNMVYFNYYIFIYLIDQKKVLIAQIIKYIWNYIIFDFILIKKIYTYIDKNFI